MVQTGRIPDRLVRRTGMRSLRLGGVSSHQPQTSGLSVVQHRLQHRNRKVRETRSVLIELQPTHHAMLAHVFPYARRSEEHTSELQSPCNLVCRLLLEKKKKKVEKI